MPVAILCRLQVIVNTSRSSAIASNPSLPYTVHRDYQQRLALSESHLDGILADVAGTLDFLDGLTKSFKAVQIQTTSFQHQCDGLIQEKSRLEKLANDLDHNLKYYNYLEPATRRLNAPGAGSLVRSQEFSDMLARIDECLDFMAAHVGTASFCCRLRS